MLENQIKSKRKTLHVWGLVNIWKTQMIVHTFRSSLFSYEFRFIFVRVFIFIDLYTTFIIDIILILKNDLFNEFISCFNGNHKHAINFTSTKWKYINFLWALKSLNEPIEWNILAQTNSLDKSKKLSITLNQSNEIPGWYFIVFTKWTGRTTIKI